MAQLVGGIIGGAIGFAATGGNPLGVAAGFAIGSTLGGIIDPTIVNAKGPRLTDTGFTASTYGAPINIIYGAARLSGVIIWALPLIEKTSTTTHGGKGGAGGGTVQKTTTYSYYFTGAILLCEGPVEGLAEAADA